MHDEDNDINEDYLLNGPDNLDEVESVPESDDFVGTPPTIFSNVTQADLESSIADLFYKVIGVELREFVTPPTVFDITLKGQRSVAYIYKHKEDDPIGITITSFGTAE